MIDKDRIYQDIAEALYNKGIINQEVYHKCTKPYITILPYDLRTNDSDKLQERKTEIEKQIDEINLQLKQVDETGQVISPPFLKELNTKSYDKLDKKILTENKELIQDIKTLNKYFQNELKKNKIPKPDKKTIDDYLYNNIPKDSPQGIRVAKYFHYNELKKDNDIITEMLKTFKKSKVDNSKNNMIHSKLTQDLDYLQSKLHYMEVSPERELLIKNNEEIIKFPENYNKIHNNIRKLDKTLLNINRKEEYKNEKKLLDKRIELIDYILEKEKIEDKLS